MEQPSQRSRFLLALEWVLLFFGLPLLCLVASLVVIPVLIGIAISLFIVLVRDSAFNRRVLTRLPGRRERWNHIMLRWLIALPLLAILLAWLHPTALLQFPRQRTGLWLVIMFAYPLISVVPQEIIYRVYFAHRYRPLFIQRNYLCLASALSFGFAHIVFRNPVAVALTLVGGWVFARTYERTQSLLAVAIEHALYGCAIFTLGLGEFFYHGTLRLFDAP